MQYCRGCEKNIDTDFDAEHFIDEDDPTGELQEKYCEDTNE